MHYEEEFICSICGMIFSNRKELTDHETEHFLQRENQKFSCSVCEEGFKYRDELTNHKFTHIEEKIYNCEACAKSFALKCTLEIHHKIHTGKKPVSCPICGEDFTQFLNFKYQQLIDNHDKPFSCDICDSKFSRKISLIAHFLEHELEGRLKSSMGSLSERKDLFHLASQNSNEDHVVWDESHTEFSNEENISDMTNEESKNSYQYTEKTNIPNNYIFSPVNTNILRIPENTCEIDGRIRNQDLVLAEQRLELNQFHVESPKQNTISPQKDEILHNILHEAHKKILHSSSRTEISRNHDNPNKINFETGQCEASTSRSEHANLNSKNAASYPFLCPYCGQNYIAKRKLTIHIRKVHGTDRFKSKDEAKCELV